MTLLRHYSDKLRQALTVTLLLLHSRVENNPCATRTLQYQEVLHRHLVCAKAGTKCLCGTNCTIRGKCRHPGSSIVDLVRCKACANNKVEEIGRMLGMGVTYWPAVF